MKIKRFFEAEENLQIADDTIQTMLDEIKEISSLMDEKREKVENMINKLNNFKSKTNKANTQVDDSFLYLQEIEDKMQYVIGRLDDVHTNLNDYNDSGEKFLY